MRRVAVAEPVHDIDLFAARGRWGKDPSVAEYIDASGDCWLWTGRVVGGGYGETTIGGVDRYVHRVVWEALVGPIPDGLQVDHMCRVRRCANPDHLRLVTSRENTLAGYGSGFQRNSRKTHCPDGHPYSGPNLYRVSGARRCRSCLRGQGRWA